MNLLHAVVLGIVEGITEFLPISSTAHLELTGKFLRLANSDFIDTFNIVIQFGAILAVVILYFSVLKRNWKVWKRIFAAFIPTAVIGFALYKVIKNILHSDQTLSIIVWTLGIGGVLLIIFERIYGKKEGEVQQEEGIQEIEKLPYKKAVLIGLAQAIAMVPGVSRSGATIVAGRMLGLSRQAIVDFSFLLAVPTMFAASGYDLLKNYDKFSTNDFGFLAVGFVVAFIFAFFTAKWLLAFVRKHGFTLFGYYRIILAVILFFFLS